MKKWSDEAWEASADIYRQILEHPFIKGLISGTLPRECFIFYLQQDSIYLRHYFRVLANIATRTANIGFADDFMHFACDGIAVESALHESYLQGNNLSDREMSPSCALYTSTLLSQSYQPVEVEAAAVLPCFWVYQKVGEHILGLQEKGAENPYSKWIETYADPVFAASTKRAIEMCDEMAESTTPAIREKMTAIFKQCTRLEWMFWDSAWNLEKWKI